MAEVRDVAIIVLAIESIVVGVVLIFLVIQVNSLIRLLKEEIKPLLDSANETASTLRGTTTFISDKVVNPIVSATSFVSGAQQAAKTLLGLRRRAPGDKTETGEG
ncbi:MAG: hypothetical protein H5T65_07775 [Chloroflexi bacterium]|nr:hypothetical protein [Chloroflexota bacterium]